MENTISIEIPADVVAGVVARFGEIEAMLKPYVVRVSEDDKPYLLKVGDKTFAFVEKVKDYASAAPEFAPAHLDLPEFGRDKAAYYALDVMARASAQVGSMLDDTLSLAANDSYAAALIYYKSVKAAAEDGVAKAKPIYEDLARRFPSRSKSMKEQKSEGS